MGYNPVDLLDKYERPLGIFSLENSVDESTVGEIKRLNLNGSNLKNFTREIIRLKRHFQLL